MNKLNKRHPGLLLAAFLLTGLSACGGGGGGGESTAEPNFRIGAPAAQAVDGAGQAVSLQLQSLVQPEITLID